jgi:uroporphyrinogen decarboxylase
MGSLLHALAGEARARLASKRARTPAVARVAPVHEVAPAPADAPPVVRALRREPLDVTPVWLMRQAGRYLPSYRAVRAKVPLLELCKRPDLACEVTVDAAITLGVDAAIVFSDLLLPLEAMGARVEFLAGEGPVVADPVRESEDVARLAPPPPGALACVGETIRLARAALPAWIAMLGFAGAPFTLAAYLIEGRPSRTYEHTKLLMHRDRGAWTRLLDVLARTAAAFLVEQIRAGADAVQLFDTAIGGLGPDDYRSAVLPHVQAVVRRVHREAPGTPVILFGTGCAGLLSAMRESGADAIAVDWRVDLGAAWAAVGHDRAIQGNLDPAVLFAAPGEIERRARAVLASAAGRPGHVFNLGHGILPRTPVDAVRRLVDVVHEASDRRARLTGPDAAS